MFRFHSAGFVLAAMLALAAPAGAEEQRAEVIHWWTSGGESAAVKVFADQFQAAGGTWVDTAIAGGANARTASTFASEELMYIPVPFAAVGTALGS